MGSASPRERRRLLTTSYRRRKSFGCRPTRKTQQGLGCSARRSRRSRRKDATVARPTLVLFDVNETLSDLEPIRPRFEEVGAPGDLLEVWFASTLRDGLALTAAGAYADSGGRRRADGNAH